MLKRVIACVPTRLSCPPWAQIHSVVQLLEDHVEKLAEDIQNPPSPELKDELLLVHSNAGAYK